MRPVWRIILVLPQIFTSQGHPTEASWWRSVVLTVQQCAVGSGGVTVLCITSLLVVSLLGHLFFMGLQQKLGSRSTNLSHFRPNIPA